MIDTPSWCFTVKVTVYRSSKVYNKAHSITFCCGAGAFGGRSSWFKQIPPRDAAFIELHKQTASLRSRYNMSRHTLTKRSQDIHVLSIPRHWDWVPVSHEFVGAGGGDLVTAGWHSNAAAGPAWTVLELTRGGEASKPAALSCLTSWILRLNFFMWVILLPRRDYIVQLLFHSDGWKTGCQQLLFWVTAFSATHQDPAYVYILCCLSVCSDLVHHGKLLLIQNIGELFSHSAWILVVSLGGFHSEDERQSYRGGGVGGEGDERTQALW